MRTAEEWYLKINSYSNPSHMNDVEKGWVMKMINEARKETIEELANKTYIADNNFHPVITKEEILLLIKELK